MGFANKQGITGIKYENRVRCFCPLGNDWYSADVRVLIENPEEIPDYCVVDKYIRGLDGGELILEDVCARVFSFIEKETNAKHISVKVSSSDAVHSSVTVEKQK